MYMKGGEVLCQREVPELALDPGVLLAHHHHPECLGPHHVQLQVEAGEDQSLPAKEKLIDGQTN